MAQEFEKYQPRSGSGGVDGLLLRSGQTPRRPTFRSALPPSKISGQTLRGATKSSVSPQPRGDTMAESLLRLAPSTANITSETNGNQIMKANTDTIQQAPERPRRALSSAKDERPGQKKPKIPLTKKKLIKRIAKITGAVLLVAILFFGVMFAINIAKVTGNKNPFALLGAFQRTPIKNDNGRVNILVAGNSADDTGHSGASLTDSIMVLSMDTNKKTAMMLSIPRDMWVNVPSHGHTKINAAYTYGGMSALKQVVEDNLGLNIHYTVLVNYSAFKDLVDAVGGITVNIESTDKRGIYDSSLDWTTRNCCALAKYPNGLSTLNGKQALNLARARGEGYGSYGYPQADFTRTEYQRKMLLAIFAKAVATKNPIKLNNIVGAVAKNVTTDVQTNEMQSMYSYAKDINLSSIDSYNVNTLAGSNKTMLQGYTTSNGQSALIPAAGIDDYSDIAAQIEKVLNATPITKEAARVVVLNGTDTVGLAKQESAKLITTGMDVVIQGNATVQATTTIVDMSNGKKPASLADLQQRYSATVKDDATLRTGYPNADFVVVLGKNILPAQTTTSTSPTTPTSGSSR